MADHSLIGWTDATWNPVLGCAKVSPGCRSCYAIGNARIRENNPHPKIAEAYAGLVVRDDVGELDWTGRINLLPGRLDKPLRWKASRRIFVNSQSDLFHPRVPTEYVAQVFAVMALARHHTFQILTKRHDRMRSLMGRPDFRDQVTAAVRDLLEDRSSPIARGTKMRLLDILQRHAGKASPPQVSWPLRNVWLGVSVEDQACADLRIPHLRRTPAAVRFLSCEPLLEPIRLCICDAAAYRVRRHPFLIDDRCPLHGATVIDWVIVGGESGSKSRPMRSGWVHSLMDQCHSAGVAFYFKQAGKVLAHEWGLKGKGDDPGGWPEPFPREYPAIAPPTPLFDVPAGCRTEAAVS